MVKWTVHVRTELHWLGGLSVQVEPRGALTMALLKANGYLWVGKDDPVNHLIHFETTVPEENSPSLTSSLKEYKM